MELRESNPWIDISAKQRKTFAAMVIHFKITIEVPRTCNEASLMICVITRNLYNGAYHNRENMRGRVFKGNVYIFYYEDDTRDKDEHINYEKCLRQYERMEAKTIPEKQVVKTQPTKVGNVMGSIPEKVEKYMTRYEINKIPIDDDSAIERVQDLIVEGLINKRSVINGTIEIKEGYYIYNKNSPSTEETEMVQEMPQEMPAKGNLFPNIFSIDDEEIEEPIAVIKEPRPVLVAPVQQTELTLCFKESVSKQVVAYIGDDSEGCIYKVPLQPKLYLSIVDVLKKAKEEISISRVKIFAPLKLSMDKERLTEQCEDMGIIVDYCKVNLNFKGFKAIMKNM